jgi:formylglycine-generating enzyme required for sulfatase activity
MKLINPLLANILVRIMTACDSTQIEAPDGMVYFRVGEIVIGSENERPNEAPSFLAEVEPFFMDKSAVTVAKYRKFVKKTGYVTDAQKLGYSPIIDSLSGNWILIEGASWEKKGAISIPVRRATRQADERLLRDCITSILTTMDLT